MQPELAKPVMDVGGVDHEWLREHLGWSLSGREAITVRSISQSGGLMGSVHQVSCAGRSFIFKGPPDNLSAWGSLLTDTGLIEREVQAYRFLQARGTSAPKVSPKCYWSALGPDGRGALALEDLGAPVARRSAMASGLSHAQAVAAVRCLAMVHSTLAAAGADPLSPPYPWLYTASSEGLIAAVQMGVDDLPRVTAECWPQGLPGVALQRILDVDVEAVLARSHVGATCVSLCHGDAWASNILFVPLGESPDRSTAFLVDWQFAMWGNPLSDVALLLLSSLGPASREAWEDELLGHYHATLTAHCALEYTLAACREDFRRAEPFAALVALASLEAYTSGMGPDELSRFAVRALAAMDRVAVLANGDAPRA
jgi:hypothetical protein